LEKEEQQIALDNVVVKIAAVTNPDGAAIIEMVTRRCFVTVRATKEGGLIFTNQASGEQWIATAKN